MKEEDSMIAMKIRYRSSAKTLINKYHELGRRADFTHLLIAEAM
jgi:hypothetical protein